MACFGQDHLHGIDEETANLIINLQIQDAELHSSSANGKGKGREGEFTDESLAFQLQKQELDNVALYFSDRRMARSIANTVQTDGPIVMDATLQENIAVGDRDLIQGLRGNAELPDVEDPNANPETQELDDESLEKHQAPFVSGSALEHNAGLDGGEQAESSTWAAGRSAKLTLPSTHCEACGDEKNSVDIGRAPCNHEYCRDCLQDLFKAAISDESLFPPRCCRQPIPLETIRIFLTSELAQDVTDKTIEFETPNKTYCCVQTCSAFIRSGNITDNVGTCHKCDSTTCTLCKSAGHGSGECPSDPALQQILETARDNGWQRCNSCSSVVELDHGCNHITCRCGAQFCYLCGVKWRNCTCAQWDEHRLFDRANQVAARQPGADHLLPGDRDALVARTAQNIRENHGCLFHEWRSIRGAHRCEGCRHALGEFIYRCGDCGLQLCKRCKNNRL